MKLIPMTDFVLKTVQTPNINEAICWEQTEQRLSKIYQYSLFLKRPLKLSMFVPCDEENNPILNPLADDSDAGTEKEIQQIKWNNAYKNVLFRGWFYISDWYGSSIIAKDEYGHKQFCIKDYQNIESLMYHRELYLTESAIKQIGL